MTSPLVMLGPALQIVRGVLFVAVLYPLREILFERRNGWLLISWMLIGVGILGTLAAPPGSLEGFIYTTVPLGLQVRGYLEIVPQALLLSALLFYWIRHPGKAWLNWSLGLAYAVCALLPILGLLPNDKRQEPSIKAAPPLSCAPQRACLRSTMASSLQVRVPTRARSAGS